MNSVNPETDLPVTPEPNLPANPETDLPVTPEPNLPANPVADLPENPTAQHGREKNDEMNYPLIFMEQHPDYNGESPTSGSSSAGKGLIGTEETENEEVGLRRSVRHREKPKNLTYPELGNPLVTIVQSLLQGLNAALSESLQDSSRMGQPAFQGYAPVSDMQRDLHNSKRGGCNPDIN